jgi:hypothetical protein
MTDPEGESKKVSRWPTGHINKVDDFKTCVSNDAPEITHSNAHQIAGNLVDGELPILVRCFTDPTQGRVDKGSDDKFEKINLPKCYFLLAF